MNYSDIYALSQWEKQEAKRKRRVNVDQFLNMVRQCIAPNKTHIIQQLRMKLEYERPQYEIEAILSDEIDDKVKLERLMNYYRFHLL